MKQVKPLMKKVLLKLKIKKATNKKVWRRRSVRSLKPPLISWEKISPDTKNFIPIRLAGVNFALSREPLRGRAPKNRLCWLKFPRTTFLYLRKLPGFLKQALPQMKNFRKSFLVLLHRPAKPTRWWTGWRVKPGRKTSFWKNWPHPSTQKLRRLKPSVSCLPYRKTDLRAIYMAIIKRCEYCICQNLKTFFQKFLVGFPHLTAASRTVV